MGARLPAPGELLAVRHNTVALDTDITAHAEVNALRTACRTASSLHLEGAVVATTCEPCPMCMAALHWARVERVYFGATIADAAGAGFNELTIPAQSILQTGGSSVLLQGDVLRAECQQLFADWLRQPGRTVY